MVPAAGMGFYGGEAQGLGAAKEVVTQEQAAIRRPVETDAHAVDGRRGGGRVAMELMHDVQEWYGKGRTLPRLGPVERLWALIPPDLGGVLR